ncbi:MAG: hypothetical protein ACXU82_03900 [Caulobacteraceae bacterium]
MSAALMGISIRAFAREEGCDDKLVRRAISAGHLKTFPDGSLDPGLVGSGWRPRSSSAAKAADTRADRAGNVRTRPAAAATPLTEPELDLSDDAQVAKLLSGGNADLATAERVKANALALRALLQARKSADSLVEIETAERILFEVARQARDAWLSFPSRVAPLLAADLDVPVDKVAEALTEHVHQQLAELGEPEADFSA